MLTCFGAFFLGYNSFSHVVSPSCGASGSIIATWDPVFICHSNVVILDWFIGVEAVWKRSGLKLLFIVIYAPQEVDKKKNLWLKILQMIISFLVNGSLWEISM